MDIQRHTKERDKAWQVFSFVSFCVRERPREAMIWWVYLRVDSDFEASVFPTYEARTRRLLDARDQRGRPGEGTVSTAEGR